MTRDLLASSLPPQGSARRPVPVPTLGYVISGAMTFRFGDREEVF
jgi:hypothetical protein